jgi:hypothetical protein
MPSTYSPSEARAVFKSDEWAIEGNKLNPLEIQWRLQDRWGIADKRGSFDAPTICA